MDLSQWDVDYAEARVVEFNNVSDLADGKYIGEIGAVFLETFVTDYGDQYDMLSWPIEIKGGEYDTFSFKLQDFINSKGLSGIKTRLLRCGIELEMFSHLELRIVELEGLTIEFNKKKNIGKNGKDYHNIYFNKLVDISEPELDQNINPDTGLSKPITEPLESKPATSPDDYIGKPSMAPDDDIPF